MPAPLEFAVTGIPVPQGSMIARMIGPRPVVVASNKEKLEPWRRRVTTTAASLLQFRAGWSKFAPVEVHLLFEIERPASVKRPRPSVYPDVDKLTRAILDALTNAGVWVDDGQVVSLRVDEYYSPTPGVRVLVRDASEDPAPRRSDNKEEA